MTAMAKKITVTAQEIEVIEAEIDGAGPGQDQEVLTETEETLVVEGTDIEGETGPPHHHGEGERGKAYGTGLQLDMSI